MEKPSKRGNGLTAAIICLAVCLLAAGGMAFFLADGMRVNGEIAAIDGIRYEDTKAQKGAQRAAKGVALTAEQAPESLDGDVYHTPLGFSIVSHATGWRGQELVDIYDELLKNGHGDEIGYLSEVVLYGGAADYSAIMEAAGDRKDASVDKDVYVDVPALIPSGLRYDTDIVVSVITLYNMDRYNDASEVAKTLAHEYGHHYTMYHFMQDDAAVKASEYYVLRDFADYDHEVFYDTALSYYENHMWDIYEIAAEDYVQLLGSPTTMQTGHYMDRMELIKANYETYSPKIRQEYINVFPQENIFIPLADEVPGLRDYFYSWIDKENDVGEALAAADFGLKIQKKSSRGHRYYNITWNKTSTDPDALYTLVCYDTKGDFFRPVSTVRGDEEALAVVGTPAIRRGSWIYWWSDGVADKDRIFKLYLLLPDGRMQASAPFRVDF